MSVFYELAWEILLRLCIIYIIHVCLQAVASSDVATSTHSTLLEHRSLVRVRGQDASTFLQGLVTADVSNLDEQQSQYSMLLNAQVSILMSVIASRVYVQ